MCIPFDATATRLGASRPSVSYGYEKGSAIAPSLLLRIVLSGAYRSTASANCISATQAECRDSLVYVAADHLVEQRHQNARAARADRMSQRHRSAIHVDLVEVEPELARDRDRRHRERLVDLVQIDVFVLPARLLPDLANRVDRAPSSPTPDRYRWSPAPRCAPSASARVPSPCAADITTTAAAPSFTPGALPAVTVPSFLNAGFRPRRASMVVSSRGTSSLVKNSGGCALLLRRKLDRHDLVLEAAFLDRG